MSSNVETHRSSQPMLSAKALFCERDDRVLFQHLDFELQTGELMQVQGSNGSGKTTLMRILCGLYDNYDGEIFWHDELLQQQVPEFRASLLYIGHRVGVNKVLTPMENLRWSCSLQIKVSDQDILQALAEVELRGFEESPCYTLSAGQQQRVSLARLSLSPASLWVLDEPFTTLDARGVGNLEKLLASHAGNGGSALVTTHHPLNVADLRVLSLG